MNVDPKQLTDDELSDAVTAMVAENRKRQAALPWPHASWESWEPFGLPVLDEYKRRHTKPKVRERRRK